MRELWGLDCTVEVAKCGEQQEKRHRDSQCSRARDALVVQIRADKSER